MGGKNKKNIKNKHTTSNKQVTNNYDPPGETEEIIEEVIFIRELFQKTKQRLRQSEHRYGYLLSNKWLGTWKAYTGYEALVKSINENIQIKVLRTVNSLAKRNLRVKLMKTYQRKMTINLQKYLKVFSNINISITLLMKIIRMKKSILSSINNYGLHFKQIIQKLFV